LSKRVVILLFLLWLAAPGGAAAGDWAKEEPRDARYLELDQAFGLEVAKVEIDVPYYMNKGSIQRVLKIKEKRPLMRWRVRESLDNVFLLGDVENAKVMAELLGDGRLKVTVKIYPRYYIRDIKIEGNTAYNTSEILYDILHIELGDDYRPEELPTYKKKLLTALREAGHLNATVRIESTVTKRKDDNKADLLIKITENTRAQIVTFDFSEAKLGLFTEQEIMRKAGWENGMPYRQATIDKGLARLQKWLRRENLREARLPDLEWGDRDSYQVSDDKKEVKVLFPLVIGPRIELFFDNECFSCSEMKWKFNDLLGYETQRRFNKWIAQDYAERIKLHYQRQGYYLAQTQFEYLEYKDAQGQPVKRINITAEKGPKVSIRSIDFSGNDKYDSRTLRGQMINTKIYVEQDFANDLENVIRYYNTNGYLRAKVARQIVVYDEDKRKIDISIYLEEGPRTKIRAISFAGNEQLSEKKFIKVLEEMEGAPRVGEAYNPFVIDQAKTLMLAEYLRRGYAKARIRERVQLSDDGREADLTFEIAEGMKYEFGNIYIRGNKLTKKHVILRELVIVEDRHDPYDFEKVFRSEQALIALGFFNSVDIQPINKDWDEPVVDVMVTVNERKGGYITGGAGYNTYAGYSGAWEIGHRNLAGHGRRLSFRFDGSVKDEDFELDRRNTVITFTWPWIARVPLDGILTIRESQLAEIAYDMRQLSVTIGLTLKLKKLFNFLEATHRNQQVREMATRNHGFVDPFTVQLEWEYARDFYYNIEPDAAEDQSQGLVQLSTLSPILIHDLRDDVFYPTRWTYNSIRFDYGPPWFLSEIHYLKVTGTTAWYLPIFEVLRFIPNLVLAERVVVGHLQALRQTDTVPINRRFFLGGSLTMRGFVQNQISPLGLDDDLPVGGYFMGYQNTELRFPIVGSFGMLLFFDAGNVTDSSKEWDIRNVRTTAGLGLRYLLPVGPISADYGFKLDREEGESIGEFYITIGNAF